MSLSVGPIMLVSKGKTTVNLSCVAAQGGVGPYTYQWYRDIVSGFTPGPGNDLPGETALTLADTALDPGTQYFYKLVATDTGDSGSTAETTQFAVTTISNDVNPNQFAQTTQIGVLDQRFNYNTFPCQIDASQATPCLPAQAMKIVDSGGGVPKVVACDADDDNVLGFLTYNIKNRSFVAYDACELSLTGNVMWLKAVGPIARGAQVVLDTSLVGGVAEATGSTGSRIVGWAYDKVIAPQDFIRVYITTPNGPLDT